MDKETLVTKALIRTGLMIGSIESVEPILKKVGVQVKDELTGEYRPFQDIIQDLNPIWDMIPDGD